MTGRKRLGRRRNRIALAAGGAALLLAGAAGAGLAAANATTQAAGTTWVGFSGGKLSYGTDAQGNRVPDFSSVGYHAGDRAIPVVPVTTVLGPTASGDDTARIQAAIEHTAHGAVLLKPGSYRIGGTIAVDRSGVVLRGSGDGTVLVGTGKPHTLVTVGGAGAGGVTQVGSAYPVTDSYVPVGGTTVHVSGAATHFKPGERIVVQRPWEQAWIHAIGMDHIPPRPGGHPSTQWSPGPGNTFERTVKAVAGDAITLDVPLPQALEKQYAHSTVWAYSYANRISEAGVEDLSGDGKAFEKDPSWHGGGYFASALVTIGAAENSWGRNLTAHHFGSAFAFGGGALRDSLVGTASLDASVPLDIHAQPVAYTLSGQQTLISGCRVTGTNQHAWATQARIAGPNVITNCSAVNTGSLLLDAGPHQRWATGTLYDDVTMDKSGKLALHDRQWMGSGQGWAGANDVAWNSAVGTLYLEGPPTAHNWAIGPVGTLAQPGSGHVMGSVQSAGTHLLPTSLYAEQLKERLGG